MFALPPEIVVFDTEYTAWEGSQERNWSGPNEYREIVQIGAMLVNAETLAGEDTFLVLAKPVKNPTLSEYFIHLTGITQQAVDRNGLDFPEAVRSFAAWVGGRKLYCFGSDGEVFRENCELCGIEFPFDRGQFADVRAIFQRHGIPADEYQSGTIIRAFGKEPSRRGHDALNDARTIVDGLRELAASRSALPPRP